MTKYYRSVNKKSSWLSEALRRGDEWARTTDSRIFSPMLYQLSYITGIWRPKGNIISSM